jgi:hypothetical protein
MFTLKPGQPITSYEQLKHGMSVTCRIDGNEIADAKISISKNAWGEDRYFICQNMCGGSPASDLLGYKHSWSIGHPNTNKFSKNLYDEDVTEFCFTGPQPNPEPWQAHYTKPGHTLSADKIKLASGKEYTPAELQAELNLLRSIQKAHRKYFPSAK